MRSPSWAEFAYDEWRLPLLIAVGIGTFCIVGPLIYWAMENKATKRFQLGEAGETDKVTFSQLFGLGRSYWFVVLLCVTFYSAIFPFQTFAIKFFQEAHGTTRADAGELSALITLFSMMLFLPHCT